VRSIYKSFGVKELTVVVAYFLSIGSSRDTENAGLASQTTDCKFQFTGADKGLISISVLQGIFYVPQNVGNKIEIEVAGQNFYSSFREQACLSLDPLPSCIFSDMIPT
jgi:hypothetical protein